MTFGLTVNIISAGPAEAPMLRELAFSLKPGGHAVVTGASGSGKTTLLRILGGLMQYRGRVGYINASYAFDYGEEQEAGSGASDFGTDVDMPSEKRVNRPRRRPQDGCRDNTLAPGELLEMGEISMLFQENRLLPELSAIDNLRVTLPPDWRGRHIASAGDIADPADSPGRKAEGHKDDEISAGRKKRLLRGRLAAELEMLLPGVDLEKPVSRLSGGEQRRVAIARAMVQDASVILLDEPFTGLDIASAELVRQYISRRGEGKTLLLTEHEGEHFPDWKRVEVTAAGKNVPDETDKETDRNHEQD